MGLRTELKEELKRKNDRIIDMEMQLRMSKACSEELRTEIKRLKNAMSWAVDNFPGIRSADDCTFDGETFVQIAEAL